MTRLDELDADLQDLFDEMAAFEAEVLQRCPAPGKWSPLQVMQHLMKVEDLSHRYLEKKLSFNPVLKTAGLGADFRAVLLKVYLALPFKFKAPPVVGEEVFESGVSLPGLAERWQARRRELRMFLDGLPDEVLDKEAYRHPFAGRLSILGMVDFFDRHFRRHREQIRKALKE